MPKNRRNAGPQRRSVDWRDPRNLAKLNPEARTLCSQIADAFDDLEQRSGPADRRDGPRS